MRRAVAALTALITLAAACGGGDDEPVAEEVDETSTVDTEEEDDASEPETDDGSDDEAPPEIDEGPKAPFTGLSADEALLEQPAIVVKISNNNADSLAALIGIEFADVVIEERIEARATRFAAIFHSSVPELIGPVRSARTTDIDLLTNLGNPILIFSGANLNVLRDLRELALADGVVLVVDDGTGDYLFRDNDFRSPDNLFIDATVALDDFGADAGVPDSIVSFRDAESDTRPASVDGSAVTITGRDIVSFVYDADRGYVRVQDGAVHVTREGTPIEVTNLVVMETRYVPNATDPQSIDAITVGEGPVSVMIGGRRFDGTWSRADEASPYEFRTDNGEEIVLEPGQTWITLAPADSYEFGADAETQGLVLGSGE